jgi:hypothetical protein
MTTATIRVASARMGSGDAVQRHRAPPVRTKMAEILRGTQRRREVRAHVGPVVMGKSA